MGRAQLLPPGTRAKVPGSPGHTLRYLLQGRVGILGGTITGCSCQLDAAAPHSGFRVQFAPAEAPALNPNMFPRLPAQRANPILSPRLPTSSSRGLSGLPGYRSTWSAVHAYVGDHAQLTMHALKYEAGTSICLESSHG